MSNRGGDRGASGGNVEGASELVKMLESSWRAACSLFEIGAREDAGDRF